MFFKPSDHLQYACLRNRFCIGRLQWSPERNCWIRTPPVGNKHPVHGAAANGVYLPIIQRCYNGRPPLNPEGECLRGVINNPTFIFNYGLACLSCHSTFKERVIEELEQFSTTFFDDDLEDKIKHHRGNPEPGIWHNIVKFEWQAVTKRLWDDISTEEQAREGSWKTKMSSLNARANEFRPDIENNDVQDFKYLNFVVRAEIIARNAREAVAFINQNVQSLDSRCLHLARNEENGARRQLGSNKVSNNMARLLDRLQQLLRDNPRASESLGSRDRDPRGSPAGSSNLITQFGNLGLDNSPAGSAYSSDRENQDPRNRERQERRRDGPSGSGSSRRSGRDRQR